MISIDTRGFYTKIMSSIDIRVLHTMVTITVDTRGFCTRVMISIDTKGFYTRIMNNIDPRDFCTRVMVNIDSRGFYTRIKNSEEFLLGNSSLCPCIMKTKQNNYLKKKHQLNLAIHGSCEGQ